MITWDRYYHDPPEKKSLEQCESHGNDHAVYCWSPQVDPRWSEAQKQAYWKGYNAEKGKHYR